MGYRIEPKKGIVFGLRGKPIRKRIKGYICVYNRMTKFQALAHRMIWESVHGKIPDGMQINHINGIKDDNRIENLELVTPSKNALHAYRIGLQSAVGEANGRAKLNPGLVREARRRAKEGESCASIAEDFGVSSATIYNAVNRRTWRSVTS